MHLNQTVKVTITTSRGALLRLVHLAAMNGCHDWEKYRTKLVAEHAADTETAKQVTKEISKQEWTDELNEAIETALEDVITVEAEFDRFDVGDTTDESDS